MNYIGIDCDSKQIAIVILDENGKWIKAYQYSSNLTNFNERFSYMVEWFESKCHEIYYPKSKLSIEESIYIQNAKATINISKVTGYIQSTAIREGIPWKLVDNKTWKKDIVANGSATKDQIISLARGIWKKKKIKENPITNEHIADAACIALWGVRSEKSAGRK